MDWAFLFRILAALGCLHLLVGVEEAHPPRSRAVRKDSSFGGKRRSAVAAACRDIARSSRSGDKALAVVAVVAVAVVAVAVAVVADAVVADGVGDIARSVD